MLAGVLLTQRRVRRMLQAVYENGQQVQAQFLRHIRRAVVFIIGTSVVLVGVIMFVTPGPAVVMIPAGLGILATEFVWARRLLKRVARALKDTGQKVTGRRDGNASESGPDGPPDGHA